MMKVVGKSLALLCSLAMSQAVSAQTLLEIPRQHERPPGDPISAEEAVKRMTVPEGFTVDIVGTEPEIVNPIGMFIDEQGRYWITESLEYPRREPGPGRDKVKVHEDTDGDGRIDKTVVFADGLNIPSGVAVGYGGVWVVNAPDLLYMQDTDGDLVADKVEVVLTGFGRTDTHELPNSLTWGPDGWLYGLNGVFNHCHVTYPENNPNYSADHPGWKFNCALWRVHPRTKEFQIFVEGTSNPWGIAIDNEGELFSSACVIDHLWHFTESGYYIRQGGPYPPQTWPIASIVEHKHQKAAYCGITWFDSDAYPEEYRNVLFMGNIHGGCINADLISRHGSTYKGRAHPGFPPKPGAWEQDKYNSIAKTGEEASPKLADFMTANDAWFMPVVQKVGPDGCLYVLDWYDQYHCYQDANADPEGVERAKGRLYRVRYKDNPYAQPFNLNQKTDDELIVLLGDRNIYFRDSAQRLLSERGTPATAQKLEQLIFSDSASAETKRHALWSRAGFPESNGEWLVKLLASSDPVQRAFGIRLIGNNLQSAPGDVQHALSRLSQENVDARELTQIAVLLGKRNNADDLPLFLELAIEAGKRQDHHLQQIIWQNWKQGVSAHPQQFADLLINASDEQLAYLAEAFLPRSIALLADHSGVSGETLGKVTSQILVSNVSIHNNEHSDSIKEFCLSELIGRIRSGGIKEDRLETLKTAVSTGLQGQQNAGASLAAKLATLQGSWGDADAQKKLRQLLTDNQSADSIRLDALLTLILADDSSVRESVRQVLTTQDSSPELRAGVIGTIARSRNQWVAKVLLNHFESFEETLRPNVVEVLTQRPHWSLALFQAIDAQQVDAALLNFNQLQRVASFKNEELQKLLAKHFGHVRNVDADRQRVVNRQRDFMRNIPGDPHKGIAIFQKQCAQCHKIYGEGADVGPDITRNGRNDWNQLLQNVFDPSAVIGADYQARLLATVDGRVLTGLPVEESDEKVVLKMQGGKVETIARDDIEIYQLSELSMMPQDLEKLMTPQEIADLFAFLSLDRHPDDPEAKLLPGAPPQKRRD